MRPQLSYQPHPKQWSSFSLEEAIPFSGRKIWSGLSQHRCLARRRRLTRGLPPWTGIIATIWRCRAHLMFYPLLEDQPKLDWARCLGPHSFSGYSLARYCRRLSSAFWDDIFPTKSISYGANIIFTFRNKKAKNDILLGCIKLNFYF